jgi:hypothetical protein
MWKLRNTWREQQLAAFQKNCSAPLVIQQDQDLIDFIHNNKYTTALAYGDTEYFNQYINLVEDGTVNFCIFIINSPFEFSDVVKKINNIIQYNVNKEGIIYLAINKFLALPCKYSKDTTSNYNQLIYQYVKDYVNAEILSYSFVENDQGTMFNFVHPLTRFYIKV